MNANLRDLVGRAPVQFWCCPYPSHGWEPGQEPRVTVEWDGDLARCTTCGRTNADPQTGRLIRPCLAHVHECNELANAGLHNHAVGLADECQDCLTTHPTTALWG